jgi:hypothetical protein
MTRGEFMIHERKRTFVIKLLFLLITCILLFTVCAYAAPGGEIVEAAFKTRIGKIIFVLLALLLSPLIIYVTAKEKIAISRAQKALNELAKVNSNFRWTALNERAHEVVTQVYSAWKKADVEQAMEWMTQWYWQNQKLTVLDEWESEGLRNICKLNKIRRIKPIYVEYEDEEPGDGNGSRVVLLVEVNLQDYLIDINTDKLVKGDKKPKDYESIWTFIIEDEKWKLTMIEESSLSLHYAKMKNDIGNASEYVSSGFKYIGAKIKNETVH